MKCSESWLREWVNPDITHEKLCTTLTMAGLEVESGDAHHIDIAITPNRGDCLSVRGIAREVSALTATPLQSATATWHPEMPEEYWLPVALDLPKNEYSLPITIRNKPGCPRYLARVIRGVRADITTPDWIANRLLSAGMKVISPIVDVTNYVMLELGQPMHAFDLSTIQQGIVVRSSKRGEQIKLLDGSDKELDDDTLVIADHEKILAIAGVMGGLSSCVTLTTTDILLESAFFSPNVIAKQRQYYNLNSDSAYRFERGVDPTIQRQAIERATQLILSIVGGNAGPVLERVTHSCIPKRNTITLSAEKIKRVLGISIPQQTVEDIFLALHFEFKRKKNKWLVKPPAYRLDLTLPEDLIEEIIRVYGYDKIPVATMRSEWQVNQPKETAPDLSALRLSFANQGYHEIISYSFVDNKLQHLLNPNDSARELLNPITAEMAVMRTNLWPGLINAMLYNKNHQQQRVRLFETGVCFVNQANTLQSSSRIAGLITGLCYPEQWGIPVRNADFYDAKGNLENILKLCLSSSDYAFKPDQHPALHPGQTSSIYYRGQKIGILGVLHPKINQALDLTDQIILFEMNLDNLNASQIPSLHDISKFPEVRRDIAILIKQTVPSEDIQDTIKSVASSWLKDTFVFDVYQGKGVPAGFKSIALALIWQHPTRTLVDDEVNTLMSKVIETLKAQLGAQLRS